MSKVVFFLVKQPQMLIERGGGIYWNLLNYTSGRYTVRQLQCFLEGKRLTITKYLAALKMMLKALR